MKDEGFVRWDEVKQTGWDELKKSAVREGTRLCALEEIKVQ